MDAETIKVECLKLAAEKSPHADAAGIVAVAEQMWRWVTASSPDQGRAPPENTGRTS